MHAFQHTLHFACTLIAITHIFARFSAVAYPLGSRNETIKGVGETTPLSKRSTEDLDEAQIGIFAEGNGSERDFIWSKFSYARNYFGAGNPTKEIESMALNLDHL